jgi:type IV pilus assembly protein PilX
MSPTPPTDRSAANEFVEQVMLIPGKQRSMYQPARAQRGAVMVVALIFLLLLTMLAISASGRSLLQQRMAGGLRTAQQAEISAETALRGAEWSLWTSTSKLTSAPLLCGSGILAGNCYIYDPKNTAVYGPSGIVTKFRNSATWIATGAKAYLGPGGTVDYTTPSSGYETSKLSHNPVYLIEDMGVELPPGVSGGLHESGVTGSNHGGAGTTSRHVYRITARATGGDQNTMRVLESTFAAKSN